MTKPTYQYFSQLIETKTPIVPMLSQVRVRKNGIITKELSIVYYNHKRHALSKIYGSDFAQFITDNLFSLERGMSSKILAGIVRSSKPGVIEQWSGDTIEKVNYESFSLYRGILSIVGKNDGLPLIVPQNNGIVGDLVPGIKRILDGKNPTKVREKIKELEDLQYKIVEVVSDNPFKAVPIDADTKKVVLTNDFQGLSDKQMARMESQRRL